jgi:hemolysin-activating ACP:hemolysin acyltransferase
VVQSAHAVSKRDQTMTVQMVSEMAAHKANGQGERLRPGEWKSGDRLWLVDLVEKVFKGEKVKLHLTDTP